MKELIPTIFIGLLIILLSIIVGTPQKTISSNCIEVNADPKILKCDFGKEYCYLVKGSYGIYTISCFNK